MADYLWRLALALPLVLMGVLALLLVLHRRGGGALPGWPVGRGAAARAAAPERLVVSVQSVTPHARVALLRFAGREHLVGISGETIVLIASCDAGAGPAETGT